MMPANDALVVSICQQAVTAAVPLVLAGVGEVVAERAGVINVGIEGLMLSGCIAGFAVTALSGSAGLGLGAAIGAGITLAAVFAAVTVWARTDQIVAGMAINLLAVGLSGTWWQALQAGGHGQLGPDQGFSRTGVPGVGEALNGLPVLGPIVFDQYLLCYLTALLAGAVWWSLRATRAGLIVRALGDEPDACAAAGVRVRAWRAGCVLFAGACAGAAGAYLSIMRTHSFAPMMTGGGGFVVLALVIFGRWKVAGLIGGCLLFGALDSLQQHLQGLGHDHEHALPYQLFKVTPYLVALIALTGLSRSAAGPAQLGRPWPAER